MSFFIGSWNIEHVTLLVCLPSNSVLHITVLAIVPLTAAGCFYYHNSLYAFELYSGIQLSCQKTFFFFYSGLDFKNC